MNAMKKMCINGEVMPTLDVSVRGNRRKVYEGKNVHLNDGEEFELEFTNYLQEKVGAEVYLNGKLMSRRLFLISPGEHCYLRKNIDTGNKLVFKSYEVDGGDPDVLHAIAKNGDLKVRFYKQKEAPAPKPEPKVEEHHHHHHYPPYTTVPLVSPPYTISPVWCSGMSGSSSTAGMSLDNTTGTVTIGTTFDTSNKNSRLYSSGPCDCLSKGNLSDIVTTENLSICTLHQRSAEVQGPRQMCNSVKSASKSSPVLETGRIEEGEKSDQVLQKVPFGRQDAPFYEATLKLLPMSALPVGEGPVRHYCTSCGRKVKDKWVCCPTCGTKIV